jgi:hypothetical protein
MFPHRTNTPAMRFIPDGDSSYARDREYYLNQYYGNRGWYDRYGRFHRY